MQELSDYSRIPFLEQVFKKNQGNEHYPVINILARKCRKVAQLGVSKDKYLSFLFAQSGIDELYTVDKDPHFLESSAYMNLRNICNKNNILFNHIKEDTRVADLPDVDLLYTDTEYTSHHIKCELLSYSDRVKKYIIISNTDIYREVSDHGYNLNGIHYKYPGLGVGIQEFLSLCSNWRILYEFRHDGGLSILERKS